MTDLTPPDLFCREADYPNDFGPRGAKTELKHTSTQSYTGGAMGEMTVSVFMSTDTEDRDGIVLRITSKDSGGSYIPHAMNIENGIELHLTGAIEAKTLARVLRGVLVSLPDK
jgi:hypothetical protein